MKISKKREEQIIDELIEGILKFAHYNGTYDQGYMQGQFYGLAAAVGIKQARRLDGIARAGIVGVIHNERDRKKAIHDRIFDENGQSISAEQQYQ